MNRDLKALCSLLDKERAYLLGGDLRAALAIIEQKAILVDRVEGLPTADPAQVDSLRRKAERNSLLLKAAQDGYATARQKVQAIILGVATSTYAADGSRTEIPVDRIGLQKRA